MFWSTIPGNGKTFQAKKYIINQTNSGKTFQVLLSGEISEKIVESRFKDLLGINQVEALLIKIGFITNLANKKDYLNDFLFKLCLKNYLNIEGEHFYLPNHVKIIFELASYPDEFLLESISFLRMIEQEECVFDLKKYKFSTDVFSDEQIVAFGFRHILVEYEHMQIVDYSKNFRNDSRNIQELCEQYYTIYQLTR